MLKLTYTENHLNLEFVRESLKTWLANRIILALGMSITLTVEPTRASFLLHQNSKLLSELEKIIEKKDIKNIKIDQINDSYLEIILQGCWLASPNHLEEGIFVTILGDRLESLLFQFWLEAKQLSHLI